MGFASVAGISEPPRVLKMFFIYYCTQERKYFVMLRIHFGTCPIKLENNTVHPQYYNCDSGAHRATDRLRELPKFAVSSKIAFTEASPT